MVVEVYEGKIIDSSYEIAQFEDITYVPEMHLVNWEFFKNRLDERFSPQSRSTREALQCFLNLVRIADQINNDDTLGYATNSYYHKQADFMDSYNYV
jgi:hypothetical protein